VKSPLRALYLDVCVFWDEKHKKQRLGSSSLIEYRIFRNLLGEPTFEEDGGTLPKKMCRTTLKYEQEARGSFGVAVLKNKDGTYKGVRCEPFNYSGKEVVSIPKYSQLKNNELAEKLHEGEKLTPTGKRSVWKGGYKERYGDSWEYQLEREINKKVCVVTKLIDHIIFESKLVYQGTPRENDFLIYHDHLKIFWEKSAIQYLKDREFHHRFIQILKPTYEKYNIHKRYWNCVVGDSPEMARGLDSYGFSDLEVSMSFHEAVTSKLKRDDPKKFQSGTPDQVWSSMRRCWCVEPTSERIVQDILDWPRVLQVIINAKGCVVPGEAIRSGHREVRADRKGSLTSRLRTRKRKVTMICRPIHPDAQESYDLLTKGNVDDIMTDVEALKNHMDEIIMIEGLDNVIREEA